MFEYKSKIEETLNLKEINTTVGKWKLKETWLMVKNSLDIENEGSSKNDSINAFKSDLKTDDHDTKKQLMYNIKDILPLIETSSTLNKARIKNIYSLLTENIDQGKNTLDGPYWRKELGKIREYSTPPPRCIDKNMDELIEFANQIDYKIDDPLEATIIFMVKFVLIHPYYDYNGKMSRLLTHSLLSSWGLNNLSKILIMILKFLKTKYFNKLKVLTIRANRNNYQTPIDISAIVADIYSWVDSASTILKKLETNIKLSDTELSIYILVALRTKETKQKEYTLRDIEDILNLGISKQAYSKALKKLRDLKLIINISKSKQQIFKVGDFTSNKTQTPELLW